MFVNILCYVDWTVYNSLQNTKESAVASHNLLFCNY